MIEVKKNNFFLNEEVNTFLKNIIKNKSLANGYIFYGAEGLGKKQTALQFIKEIFKQSSPSENVEERITNNNHPDFLIIEPNSLLSTKSSGSSDLEKTVKRGSEIIKIAQIRNIKTFLGQKSINSEKKIVLILDAHLLNEAASNCLLKILEEPNNGIFILLTSKLNLLLDTIISRCQLVRFRSFSSKQIKSLLKDCLDPSQFNIDTKFKLEDLINFSNGSPGKLLKNIEILNALPNEITDELNCGILLISHDLHTVMSATDHVVCLNGHVCCSGSPMDVAKNNEYKALFGEQASEILSRYEHRHDHIHTDEGEIKKN